MRATSYLALLLSATTSVLASQYDVTVFSEPGCRAEDAIGGAISSALHECQHVHLAGQTGKSFSFVTSGETRTMVMSWGDSCNLPGSSYSLNQSWTCHPLKDLQDIAFEVVPEIDFSTDTPHVDVPTSSTLAQRTSTSATSAL
ncbi:uncharacterized protein N7459_005464 [Penicillium hispanicum]|uniref:uncharacterized protein n=1 Tax=Penicillium hispanicum TaxID=1080232 RepID=UPI0025415244|nr:uncharacterized protein N7459_005464 [Penicillium hispanicum]KAJ5579479.1 hypothetical protein N7459_005464 [Penicillium hispanicum]